MDVMYWADVSDASEPFDTPKGGEMVTFWINGEQDGGEEITVFISAKSANAERVRTNLLANLGCRTTCVLIPKGTTADGRPKFKLDKYPGGYNGEDCQVLDDAAAPLQSEPQPERAAGPDAGPPVSPDTTVKDAEPLRSPPLPAAPSSPPKAHFPPDKDEAIARAVAIKALTEMVSADRDYSAEGRLDFVKEHLDETAALLR